MKNKHSAASTLMCLAGITVLPTSVTAAPVELYGKIDLSMNLVNFSQLPAMRRVMSQDGSCYGVRGVEALGQNYEFFFKIKQGFLPQTGANASPATPWGREVFMGFRHPDAGTVQLGRQWTPVLITSSKIDPFVRSQMGAHFTLLQGGADRGYGAIMTNALQYVSPSLAGLTARAMVQMPNGSGMHATALALEYQTDRVYIGLNADRFTVP